MIRFIATLKVGKPIKIGDEGDTEVTFITSASELSEVIKLTLHRKQLFKIIISPIAAEGKNNAKD